MMPSRLDTALNIIAVIVALMVVHCFGRFVFTPLMPYFIHDGIFNLAQATDLVSVNYFGYFVGAVLAIIFASPKYTKIFILSNIILSLITTISQCFTADFDLLLILRFLNGLANGTAFVLAPALVLEWLHQHHKSHLSGYMYFGVSLGLIVTSILVSLIAPHYLGITRWQPIALIASILGLWSFVRLYQLKVHLPEAQNRQDLPPLFNRTTTPLFFAYLGAGLGYILPMTFLPTLAEQLQPQHDLNPYIWILVAMSCFISTPIWNSIGHRFGDYTALVLTYFLQMLGILALFVFHNILGVIFCAILIGGSFLGSVMCTQRYARTLQPLQGIKLSACLISIYSIAQLIAPILTKYWLMAGGSLYLSFALGFIAFVLSLFFMWRIPKSAR